MELFEFNDAAWAPAVLRDIIVESLSRLLDWGGILRGLVAPFEDFLAAADAREILDLASGASGPACILAREIQRAGRTPPRFVLTDLHPRPAAWEEARAAYPGVIDFEPEPVDATHIPERLAHGRARVMINALHHLSPEIARGIFEDAVRCGSGIFISEGFERTPLGFAAMLPAAGPAFVATPFLSSHDRLAKMLLTFATPIPALAGLWDGLVSSLRVYDREDLEAMVAPFGGGYDWKYGTYTFFPGGKGYYFYGAPRRGG
jgi:hypothetical protein